MDGAPVHEGPPALGDGLLVDGLAHEPPRARVGARALHEAGRPEERQQADEAGEAGDGPQGHRGGRRGGRRPLPELLADAVLGGVGLDDERADGAGPRVAAEREAALLPVKGALAVAALAADAADAEARGKARLVAEVREGPGHAAELLTNAPVAPHTGVGNGPPRQSLVVGERRRPEAQADREVLVRGLVVLVHQQRDRSLTLRERESLSE